MRQVACGRGDDPAADVSFVGDGAPGIDEIENVRLVQRLGVVLPGSGSDTNSKSPARFDTTWTLTPVVWCLPEYSSGIVRHDQQGIGGIVQTE
jgi:hypothetical protein